MPLTRALGKQRQADHFEFKASLVDRVEFQNSEDCYTEKPILKNQRWVGGVGEQSRKQTTEFG